VVGRGIDVSGISHIINYDLPQSSDDYVHRVGRTGRISSDSNGRAFTFVTPEEGDELTQIEIRINQMLPEMKYEGLETVNNRRIKRHVDKAAEAPVVSFAVSDDWPDFDTL
jgi:ATP-dependent RNA helicase DeaD